VVAFAKQTTMMVFIEIREGYLPEAGVEKMAKDF
jgi:hypothetical protein